MLAIIKYHSMIEAKDIEAKQLGLTIVPMVGDYIELRLKNGKMGYFCVTKREFVLDEGDNHVILYCDIKNVYWKDETPKDNGNDIGI